MTVKRPPSRARRESPTTPDPIEIAMNAEAGDTAADSPARVLLAKQSRLVDAQRRNENLGSALKVLTALAGLALAAALGVMVWQASRADGVVIESFSVPPDLAAQGLTGQVVANQLQDGMTRLGTATVSSRAPATFRNAWDQGVEVEIPQTGVSIGDVQRYLTRRLGHQTRVSGELFRTAQGLELTVRTGGEAGITVGAQGEDVKALTRDASLALFQQTQPYRYGLFLANQGEADKAKAQFRSVIDGGDPVEQAWALNGLAVRYAESVHEHNALLRKALQIDPNLALLLGNLRWGEDGLGHTARQPTLRGKLRKALLRPDRGGLSDQGADESMSQLDSLEASSRGEFRKAAAIPAVARRAAARFGSSFTALQASALTSDHQPSSAAAALEGRDDVETAKLLRGSRRNGLLTPAAEIAAEREDWAEAHRLLTEFEAFQSDRVAGNPALNQSLIPSILWPQRARALAHLGRHAEAAELIGRTALDCEPCVRVRGAVAELAGDVKTADHWFSEAVRMAPASPFSLTAWGRAKLARGDLAGAIELFARAHKIAPRYADPQTYWGEALLAQGKARAAMEKFRQADSCSPNWGRNHLLWGEALAKLGKADEAREQWRKAGTLDLTPAERRRLTANLAGSA